MRSVSSSTAFTFRTLIDSSTTLIHFVHYIHGRTALIYRTLCTWLYEVFTQVIRKTFSGRISPRTKDCGVTLITVTNEPVPRPSTTFFTKHFSFQLVGNIDGYRPG